MKKNYTSVLKSAFLATALITASCSHSSENRGDITPPTPEGPSSSAVATHGQLSVKGSQLVDKYGKQVTLRGASLGWHNWWPEYYNQSCISWLVKDWNCTVVRAAIGVGTEENMYLNKPKESMVLLSAAIDAAIQNGIYVIVDWHSHDIYTNEAKAFFTEVATKYKGVPNIIYEIFNEPNGPSWDEVKAYSIEIIKTIRAIDPKNIIIVGSPEWSQRVDAAAEDPIVGYDNIMYTLHFYADSHQQWLRDRAKEVIEKGLPIFVTECGGMDASGGGDINTAEWNSWISFMNEKGISWVAWSVTDKDMETCSMIFTKSPPTGNWTNSDLKPWGQVVRTELLKYK